MESVAPQCTDLKRRYEQCFNGWFATKFLRGQADMDESCQSLFRDYQLCLKVSRLAMPSLMSSDAGYLWFWGKTQAISCKFSPFCFEWTELLSALSWPDLRMTIIHFAWQID